MKKTDPVSETLFLEEKGREIIEHVQNSNEVHDGVWMQQIPVFL